MFFNLKIYLRVLSCGSCHTFWVSDVVTPGVEKYASIISFYSFLFLLLLGVVCVILWLPV
jgi:hypothetical protein